MLSSSTSVFNIKRGDSFEVTATYTDANGVPIDLTTYTITSQLRTMTYALIDTLVCVKSGTTGVYTLSAPTGTSEWPIGEAVWDIQYQSGNMIVSTDTINVFINKKVTY